MTSFSAIGQASHSSRSILIRTGLFAVGCLLALISIFQLQRYLDHRIDLGVIQIKELAQLPHGEHLKPSLARISQSGSRCSLAESIAGAWEEAEHQRMNMSGSIMP